MFNNFNISSLFGSLSKNSISSFNFGEYNLIKSGSYKKLMRSYYGDTRTAAKKDSSVSKNDSTTNKVTDKNNKKDTTGISKMNSQATSLKKAAEAFDKSDVFKKENGSYNIDKITNAVKDFVSKYNSTIDQAGKTSSKSVTEQMGYMKSMTSTMSKALSNVGITVGTDGKMSLNTDTFKTADMKNIKSLFSGSYSYASQIADKASAVASAALRNSGIYSSSGAMSGYWSSMFNDQV